MAELVDALASGASVPRDVEVQVLSRVPYRVVIRKDGFSIWQLGVFINLGDSRLLSVYLK